MTADRMERVREDVGEHLALWHTERYKAGKSPMSNYVDGFMDGAETFRTLTDAEWAETREKVARAMHEEDQQRYMGDRYTSWDSLNQVEPGAAESWRFAAEAAMRAVGLQREGE